MSKVNVPEEIKVDLPNAETKVERSISDIQQEFTQLCTKAGHVKYQIYAFERDLETLNSRMRDLNLEAAALQGREAAKENQANA